MRFLRPSLWVFVLQVAAGVSSTAAAVDDAEQAFNLALPTAAAPRDQTDDAAGHVVTTLFGEDIELSSGAAAAKRITFPACSPTTVPAVIPPIPKPAAGGNPLLPEDSPLPAQTLEVHMRDGIGLHTLVFFPCNLVGLPKKGNVTQQYCNTTHYPDHKVGTVLFRTPYNVRRLVPAPPRWPHVPPLSLRPTD